MHRLAYTVISLLVLSLLTDGAAAHEFYVSICRIKHDRAEKRLDVAVRLFTDDLEQAIRARGGPELHLGTPGEHPESGKYIRDYILSNLRFRVNGQEVKLEFVRHQDALDATSCLFRISRIDTVDTIEVENRILTELFDAQTNIVRFNINDKRKFANLTRETPSEVLRFGP